MDKKSIYALCASIVIGFLILGVTVCYGLMNSGQRYQMITHRNSILVFDKQTGDYWQQFFPQDEDSAEWKEFIGPLQ